MKHILVPTDFSIKALNALVVACRIAKRCQGIVHLIHVVEPLLDRYKGLVDGVQDVLPANATEQLVSRLSEEIRQLAEAHGSDDYQISWEVLVGDTYREISRAAERVETDLVVMGHKGYADPSDFSLGSTTDKVIRSINAPVLTIKEVLEDTGFENIVYATDLTEHHESLAKLLKSFQDSFGSTIHIVKINTPQDFGNDDELKYSMDKLARRFELTNYTHNVYSHEDEEYGIVYFANKMKADMIAMGTHEKSGFRRLISGGSLAEEVSDHTYRPVLTFRFGL
ncbi:MAG: universal stress protein [Bacteroidota bacterium]